MEYCYYLIDIGSANTKYKPFDYIIQNKKYKIYTFDPISDAYEKNIFTINNKFGLYDKNITKPFYITKKDELSSLIKPNYELLKKFYNCDRFTITDKIKINCKPFKDVYKNDYIDMVKIDTQGSEYEILKGFGDLLNKTKVIQTEIEFVEMYTKQKTFNDINDYLRSYNFILLKFERIVYANKDEYYQYKFVNDSFGIITLKKLKNRSNNVLLTERDQIIKKLYKKDINNQENLDKLMILNSKINDIENFKNDTMMFGDAIFINKNFINNDITEILLSQI